MNQYLIAFGLLPLFGYLLGAIPFGLLIGKYKGIDIRNEGSGNIGATNVTRIIGKGWGKTCFILDFFKGFIPVMVASQFLFKSNFAIDQHLLNQTGQLAWLMVAAASILGHMFPVYLMSVGGKGIATSFGALLGVWPYFTFSAIIALALWVIAWKLWRYVSLASILAAVGFPIGFLALILTIDQWHLNQLWPLFIFCSILAILVVLRHRSNISRLLAGTEGK